LLSLANETAGSSINEMILFVRIFNKIDWFSLLPKSSVDPVTEHLGVVDGILVHNFNIRLNMERSDLEGLHFVCLLSDCPFAPIEG